MDRESIVGRMQDPDMKLAQLISLVKVGMASAPMHPDEIAKAIRSIYELSGMPIPDHEADIEADCWDTYQMCSGNLSRDKRNITDEVRFFVDISTGTFTAADFYREMDVKEASQKSLVRVELSKLCKKGVIERVGSKDGTYRKIETEIKRTKFITGRLQEFPVKLPLGMNDLCKLFAKNIVVVAGSKSAGKTALLMNIALDNQHNMPVVYLNSEMGDEEFTSRMQAFGVTTEEQIKFDCIECHNNFADHIDGSKKLYIIDFLEIHDNFYEIAKHIRAVHEKLGDGVAIIAIQKKDGERLGRGADFSMEKARLYISMDYQKDQKCTRVTIVDAKSPKQQGVRGAYQDVKIINGTTFSAVNGIKNHWELQQ